MNDWPARLASGKRIAERVAIVVAHPDDETLFCGSLLARLDDAALIHVTDGAPDDMGDAHRLGFATREAYAGARAAELDVALRSLGYTGERRGYGIRDKDAVHHLDTIVARLRDDLAGAAVVITHPYEGGHPDHDACALAVASAASCPIVEFACYCEHDGERQFGRFWPGSPEHARAIAPVEAARIEAALRAHATQAAVFGDWRPTHERWRAAPGYDFAAPPPPDRALYDGFGWSLTSDGWRGVAGRQLERCRPGLARAEV